MSVLKKKEWESGYGHGKRVRFNSSYIRDDGVDQLVVSPDSPADYICSPLIAPNEDESDFFFTRRNCSFGHHCRRRSQSMILTSRQCHTGVLKFSLVF